MARADCHSYCPFTVLFRDEHYFRKVYLRIIRSLYARHCTISVKQMKESYLFDESVRHNTQ